MKSTNIIIVIVLILIAALSYALFNSQPEEVIVNDEIMMQNDEIMATSTSDLDSSMIKEDVMISENAVVVKGVVYTAYSVEKLANADSGDVVLFFKANWCPSCRTVDADIKANMNNIPQNLTILELDYDKTSDLKKKYGVTSQHTFVQVDKDGNMIKKWTGGSTLNSVVSEVI